jgi:hypothetical protein
MGHKALGIPQPPPPAAQAKVRCNGSMHTVCFDGESIRLPSHDDLRKEWMLLEFGGGCRCLEVLLAWRDKVPSLIPDGLRGAYDNWRVARAEARRRRSERDAGVRDGWLPPETGRIKHDDPLKAVKNAVEARAQRAANAALERCGYRTRGWFDVKVGGEPGVQRHRRWTDVTVGGGWYARVYESGLAVVDGRFVLAVLTRSDVEHRRMRRSLGHEDPPSWWVRAFGEEPELSKTCVLALFQGRGNALRARPAFVVEKAGPTGRPVKALVLP